MLNQKEGMDFSSIKNNLKALNFESIRQETNNYLEAVIVQQEIEKLNFCLKNIFADPVFPANESLEEGLQKTVDSFGGIMQGQTLYFKNIGANNVFAMLWPWRDGIHTTVKIIFK
ncbi:MAG: hypothetical protein PHY35_04575 [Candidatus Omnitrophica bacterium]|jgi:hypothetical protein|nr:hypothetical protein [Candidatus Omnitrophota bacterium]